MVEHENSRPIRKQNNHCAFPPTACITINQRDRLFSNYCKGSANRPYTKTNMEDTEQNNEIIDITDDISDNNTTRKAGQGSKSTPARYQKYYKQSYRTSWESQPDFQGWLRGVDGMPSRAYCSYCEVTLFAHRLSLLKHTCTRKHQLAAHKISLKCSGLYGAGEDDSVEATEPPNCKERKTDNEPKSVNNAMGETEKLEPMEKADTAKKVQLRLKPKNQPASGMTVTIIREDGTTDPLEFAVTELNDVNDDISRTVPVPVTIVESSQPEVNVESSGNSSENTTMAQNRPSSLTTHVLDTSRGAPVQGINVSLYRLIEGRWTLVSESITTKDGRCNQLIDKVNFVNGRYKLHFDVDRYFELQRQESMFPFVEIVFDVHASQTHHHIPLLISPYGYTTYRGS